jgi:hypothetical protein
VTTVGSVSDSMESSTEFLRHHQFAPPTFSRLPPDGDEFPNNYWSDERQQHGSTDKKKLFRSELTLTKSSSASFSSAEDLGSPPPLPTSEPPKEDYPSLKSGPPPPLPGTVPPVIPAKNMAGRRPSFDDRKKLFESPSSLSSMNSSQSPCKTPSSSNILNGTGSPFSSAQSSATKGEEPSKKSVKDKIAMFSSRSSSSEDSTDTVVALPKPIANHVSSSSLSKSTVNISYGLSSDNNGVLSKSSENLLGGGGASGPLGRKGSVDLTSAAFSGSSSTSDYKSKPTPSYGTLSGSGGGRKATPSSNNNSYANSSKPPSSLYERSQSMIDVGLSSSGPSPNNYMNGASYQNSSEINHNPGYASLRYNNHNSNNNSVTPPTTNPRPVSSLMEQRRKCITKLRGLVIPDVPGEDLPDKPGPTASASVVDLPTIISKDAPLISPVSGHTLSKPPTSGVMTGRKALSRTESLDRFASLGEPASTTVMTNLYNNRSINSNNPSAKSTVENANSMESSGDWNKFQNVLPKYSPAFKRRGLSAYQTTFSSSTLPNTKTTTVGATTPTTSATMSNKFSKGAGANSATTPEPKSLESLTSPRSDSSFEFSSSYSDKRQYETNNATKPVTDRYGTSNVNNSFEKPTEKSLATVEVNQNADKGKATEQLQVNSSNGNQYPKSSNGKLEDSDNDSAVSSSRSSISHGLSPPNSPTPGDSTAATPDPDRSSREEQDKQEGSEDSSGNMDESWRILKPQSIEAINRKNVLKSAKFSSGGGEVGDNGTGDDSSLSSSNGKNRRSDDEEASYADAETEDTESSCSELEHTNKSSPRRMIVAGRVNLSQRRDSKADTEEDDEEGDTSQQSAVHMEFSTLTESPLQAIYDMEMKMAYINEVCDALNDRGRSELSSRYFSRRDSEATVIERPIEPKRNISTDAVDTSSGMDRRARNRSSSGNESDFSSNVSIGSQQNNHKSLSRETSNGTSGSVDSDRWSMLEKKYSKSMTSVNLLGAKTGEPQPQQQQQHQQVLTTATSVPKIVTSASEVVEKKIERIIEKTNADGSPTKRVTNANIPRGRNDFKSIAEKWQLIEKSSDSKGNTTTTATGGSSTTILPPSPPTSAKKPSVPEKPMLSPQSSTGSSRSQIISPPPAYATGSSSRSLSKTNSSELMQDEPLLSGQNRERMAPRISSSLSKSKIEVTETTERSWADKRRSEGGANRSTTTESIISTSSSSMSSNKRSVSVNDIRRAFEKAEIAVSSYGRGEEEEPQSPTETNSKKETGGNGSGSGAGVVVGGSLALPTAHFRVSSFDSTTSEESSATTPAGIYGSSNSLVSSAPRDPYGSITSLASSTSLISPQVRSQTQN